MKLLDTHIQTFGKLQNQTIHFEDGLNLIYGENESGKSTFHTFLQSMLFGMERGRGRASRTDTFSRYLPWESGSIYGGDLRFEYQDELHTIKRNFLLEPARDELPEGLNLTEARYKNTISIGQLACQTDQSLSGDLENHLVNLTLSGSENINIPAALLELKSTKKELEKKRFPVTKSDVSALQAEIETTERILQNGEDTSSLKHLQAKQISLTKEIKEKNLAIDRMRQLISQGKKALADHGFDTPEVLEKRRLQAENAWDTLCACHRIPFASWKTDWDLPAFFASLCFLLGACYFAIRQSSFVYVVLCYLGYMIFGMISKQFQKRDDMSHWKEAAIEYLQNEFAEILYREEVDEDNYEEYMQELTDYENLLAKTSDSTDRLEQELMQLIALQQEAASLSGLRENAKDKEFQKEELLRTYQKLNTRLEEVLQKLKQNEELQEEIDAVTRAYATLESLSTSFHEELTPELNEEASRILSELTDGRYTSMTVHKDLSITLTFDRQRVTPQQVSRGALEQVYLAFRLALIPLFFEDEPMPLFLDDTFVAYDDKRLERTLYYLSENYPGQILLFTCQKREEELLQKLELPYHKITL